MKQIFNQKLAGYLMQRGFVLLALQPDTHGTGRNVFIFRKSRELLRALDEYFAENK